MAVRIHKLVRGQCVEKYVDHYVLMRPLLTVSVSGAYHKTAAIYLTNITCTLPNYVYLTNTDGTLPSRAILEPRISTITPKIPKAPQ